MKISRLILLFLLLPISAPILAQKAQISVVTPQVTWVFDIKHDKYDTPHGSIYLRVGAKRVFVTKTSSNFQVLTQAEYKDHKVPAGALTACSGWWAGQGDDLYVIRRGKHLEVFFRGLDEQADIPPYKRIKIIPLS